MKVVVKVGAYKREYPPSVDPLTVFDSLREFLKSENFRAQTRGSPNDQYFRFIKPDNSELILRVKNTGSKCQVSLVSEKFDPAFAVDKDRIIWTIWHLIDSIAGAHTATPPASMKAGVDLGETRLPPKQSIPEMKPSPTQVNKTNEPLKFLPQTKDSMGTNYPAKKWLYILDETDQPIDLKSIVLKRENYQQQGYLNLLIAVFDSKKDDSEISEKIQNDFVTSQMIVFLREIKSRGQFNFDLNGSSYPTAKYILEKLLVQEASSDAIQPDGSGKKSRQFFFANSYGKKISLVRETMLSSSGEATKIVFRLLTG